ncbi:MAG: hypothetical protein K2J38_07200 [Muribaculaceae bacterium]|nr:hypothetical protein [Muribaculaceae bacterium]
MDINLFKAALPLGGLYIAKPSTAGCSEPSPEAMALNVVLRQCGLSLSPDAMMAVANLPAVDIAQMADILKDIYKIGDNWAPLVKGWLTPTGESVADHLATLFTNLLPDGLRPEGHVLECGHFIPDGTFDLSRYNGCPFCGKPFVLSSDIRTDQGSRIRQLTLMSHADMEKRFAELLSSATPLDATMTEAVGNMAESLSIPAGIDIPVRETVCVLTAVLDKRGLLSEMEPFYRTPADILRYAWYSVTSSLTVDSPKSRYRRIRDLYFDDRSEAELRCKSLHFRFSRTQCRIFAGWLDRMNLTPAEMCESMNPRRGMWVRLIRALRLNDYARRMRLSKLTEVLDLFYRHDYVTWAGELYSLISTPDRLLRVLAQRPGAFSRGLFAAMLHLDAEKVTEAFAKVADRVPLNLLLSLSNNAASYFMPAGPTRIITVRNRVIGIPVNPLLNTYTEEQRRDMARRVAEIYLGAISARFAAEPHTEGASIYIAPELYSIPVPVGDRSATVQDASYALPGQSFDVEGDHVRIFLHWGKGLPAQPMDMDISCALLKEDGSSYVCAYFDLSGPGVCHSGDIRQIPDKVGTAEYINIDIDQLLREGVVYAVFTSNAYSDGSIDPSVAVGWMDSRYPMTVSDRTGVAYDPSTVSHMIRIARENLTKGLAFGVLDVRAHKIIWLEMPFDGRNIETLSLPVIMAYLERLRSKTSIGEVLAAKAAAQHLVMADSPEVADEAYISAADALKIF